MKFLFVLQETKRIPKNGFHERKMKRLNPYNPLTYIVILLTFVIGIILFGLIGFWKEIDSENPFKYK